MEDTLTFKIDNIAAAIYKVIENEYYEDIKTFKEDYFANIKYDEKYQLLEEIKEEYSILSGIIDHTLEVYKNDMYNKELASRKQLLTWKEREIIKGKIELMAHQKAFANYTIEELASLLKP